VYSLAGYNAGYSRVGEWITEFGDVSRFLFVEAIPFVETRNYVRKVVVSATYYAYLTGIGPEEYLKSLYQKGDS